MKKYLMTALAAAFATTAMAQQTGSFNAAITFNGDARNLSNFVPTNYDASQSYRLIVGLHGMGDNSTAYRNALVNSLSFAAAFPNTILICPDGGNDQGRDFYQPAGDELIIQEAINYAIANYNIDPNEIILQGFSLGSRSALKYGLDHPADFKALLLNTPAIQGVKEAANESFFNYNFANAAVLPPVYITVGDQDDMYIEPINRVMTQLVTNNGKVAYKRFAGGHIVPNFQSIPYTTFFNQPYSNGLDAGIYNVVAPVRTCDGAIEASVLLQNTGNANLDSAVLVYGIGSNIDTMKWQGNLVKHQSVSVPLPNYQAGALSNNNYDFKVSVLSLNQHVADTFVDFNHNSKNVHVAIANINLPYAEHFTNENGFTNWAFNNSGDYILPFEYSEDDDALYSLNSIFIFDNSGTKEEIISPKLNLSTNSPSYLHFNVDYNYVQYTASVLGIDTVFADTLEVLVTTDCGATYQSVFKKAGAELSGHTNPMMNPLNINAMFVEKDPTSYRNFIVNLGAFAGNENVGIKFSYISALGGYIYLDDVVVNNSPVSIGKEKDLVKSVVKLYPNPSNAFLTIDIKEDFKMEEIRVLNMLGQIVATIPGTQQNTQKIEVNTLANGVYTLQIQTQQGVLIGKFTKF